MNALLLNRDGFKLPEDGWYQVAPFGDFPHAAAGVTQVVDREACDAMVQQFRTDATAPNFAGLLVDFDHFSLDGNKASEAAGWITELETRDAGLFGKIRWSDVGEQAVTGGRYRFLSPVWTRSGCVDLGNGQLRPVKLLNAALTNDPNLKGMVPLSNRSQEPEARSQNGDRAPGDSASAISAPPRETSSHAVPLCAVCGAECAQTLANTGWTDEARAASLAVRRAKAATRAAAGGTATTSDVAKSWADAAKKSYRSKYGREPITDAEISMAETLAKVPKKYRTDGAPVPAPDSSARRPGESLADWETRLRDAGDAAYDRSATPADAVRKAKEKSRAKKPAVPGK